MSQWQTRELFSNNLPIPPTTLSWHGSSLISIQLQTPLWFLNLVLFFTHALYPFSPTFSESFVSGLFTVSAMFFFPQKNNFVFILYLLCVCCCLVVGVTVKQKQCDAKLETKHVNFGFLPRALDSLSFWNVFQQSQHTSKQVRSAHFWVSQTPLSLL